MAVELVNCKNEREVKEQSEVFYKRKNDEVSELIRSGFQKMSQRQNFQNFIQDVIRRIEKDDCATIIVKQNAERDRKLSENSSIIDFFTYPRQEIEVVGFSPSRYQLPSYFAHEIDFSIFHTVCWKL